ncbi:DUF2963 domain-containing protein ['Camptotheca acuminata' phytoplasma]|uniref:DUF2963 domain-containing protein n=1 Tax='Camptotheca acuminata' phytoplasma TaxID=3239192 RepID=UPI00351A7752
MFKINFIFVFFFLIILGLIIIFFTKYNNINVLSLFDKKNSKENEIVNHQESEEKKEPVNKNIEIIYNQDKRIERIHEYFDEDKKKLSKITFYRCNGTSIWFIEEFHPKTGKKFKETAYYINSNKLHFLAEFDPNTGTMLKRTFYNLKGEIDRIE